MKVKKIIYYISPKELTLYDLKKNYLNLEGIMEVIHSYKEGVMIVTNIQSLVKGNGTLLMIHASKCAVEENIKFIELDDCSNKYRKSHNIYSKLGLSYVNEFGPEMSGELGIISKYPVLYGKKIYRLLIL
jgi:hypothetical protein